MARIHLIFLLHGRFKLLITFSGLKCFITKTEEQMKHKKHPRRGKGVCADPQTTDGSKGKFVDFAKVALKV